MLMVPFVKPAIIEHLQVILDNKRDNVVFKTFLEKDKSANTPVAVLKRMYCFKSIMKVYDFFKRMLFFLIIVFCSSVCFGTVL